MVRESSVFMAVEGGALDLLVFAPFQDHAQVCPTNTSLTNSSYRCGSQEVQAQRDRSSPQRPCEKRRPLHVIAMGRDPEVPFPVGCKGGESSAAKAVEHGDRRLRLSQSSNGESIEAGCKSTRQ